MLMFVIEDQPHRAGTHLRRKLVACLLAHGSTFSRVGASGKPGAVQTAPPSVNLLQDLDTAPSPDVLPIHIYRLTRPRGIRRSCEESAMGTYGYARVRPSSKQTVPCICIGDYQRP